MATRIKVTLDTDQWDAVLMAVCHGELDKDGWLGRQRVREIKEQIGNAAGGTGEGVPCDCEEVE